MSSLYFPDLLRLQISTTASNRLHPNPQPPLFLVPIPPPLSSNPTPRTLNLTASALPFSSNRRHSHLPVRLQLAPIALPSFVLLSIAISIRIFLLGVLPADLPDRWRQLLVYSEKAELECAEYPEHLVNAVVASEDWRFFHHVGVDVVGIARAVVYFPKGGGGSTITQQLVKNVFLKNERKISRKAVEMVLALALERRLSKRRILSSYLSMSYWGHGLYGIESASLFYFKKHPYFLSLGESAMLAGILPAPELRSPLNDPTSGRRQQIRVLKRMVAKGFLDINSALLAVKQPLYLGFDRPEVAIGGSHHCQSLLEASENVYNHQMVQCPVKRSSIWDWELASRAWEAIEELEMWAIEREREREREREGGEMYKKSLR